MNFATIQSIHDDGVTLQFDDGSASTKHYKCNAAVVFHAGDRVRVIEDSGTYVVEYPIGSPLTALAADSSTTATRHTGTTLSFFDDDPTTKRSVTSLSGSATLAQTITKLNDLLTALKAYNLLG